MASPLRRRDFLVRTGQAALALSRLPIAAPIGASVAPALQNPGLQTLIADLATDIPQWMREANVPGAAICVVHDAKIAWRRGFGVKDAASKAPIDDDTMFEAA